MRVRKPMDSSQAVASQKAFSECVSSEVPCSQLTTSALQTIQPEQPTRLTGYLGTQDSSVFSAKYIKTPDIAACVSSPGYFTNIPEVSPEDTETLALNVISKERYHCILPAAIDEESSKPKFTTKESKGKEKESIFESCSKVLSKPKKATPISIGIPSTSTAAVFSEKSAGNYINEIPKMKAKENKGRVNFELLEGTRILDDTASDHLLDKPMFFFTKNIDGVVSKLFKEITAKKHEASMKLLEAKKLSGMEESKKEEKKKAEKEKRKKNKTNSVLKETSITPQVRVEGGQIVLDVDSLTIERKQTGQDFNDGVMEVFEEDSMVRRVNSHTYDKKKQSRKWTVLETRLFFDLLSQFGTDFEMISQMIPNRTRSEVLHKYNREDKFYPEKVTEFLIHRRKEINLNQFKKMAGTELEPIPEDFNEMLLL